MQSRHGSTLLHSLSLASGLALSGCYTGIEDGEAPGPAPHPAGGAFGGRESPESLELDALSPSVAPGGVEFAVRVTGAGFGRDAVVLAGGVPLPTTLLSPGELVARSGPRPRGTIDVRVRRGDHVSSALPLRIDNAAPRVLVPPEVTVAEDEPLVLPITVADVDDSSALRVFALGLPPGAVWDEAARALYFTPDFTQGGPRHTITIVADDGYVRVEGGLDLVVLDTIRPPDPLVAATDFFDDKGHVRYTLSQVTDDYLDSPGFAGRTFAATVSVPLDPPEGGVPVRVGLHGFATPHPASGGSSKEIRISPHDPDNTYWWGYAASLPELAPDAAGEAPDYTARRILHLVEWVLRTFPEADPGRVYVFGSSMGGAGAMSLGLLRARHFAYVDARLGQAIPRNHRPGRIDQLGGLWGAPELALASGYGLSAWDHMDLTRALVDSPEARDQFVFLKHGKDDPTIHFGAAVLPSPLTGNSLYDALQSARVGHFAVWDEGGHGSADPVLGDGWWSSSWAPMGASESTLRSDRSFPAFSRSSLDDDPGSGQGNGEQDWSVNAGYAGDPALAGDCGWDGDLAGALGRWLRWDSLSLIDTADRWQVALRVLDGEGSAPPKPGYPSKGDRLVGELPALVDVTPRRLQAFRCRPGEVIAWFFGQARGEVVASADGSVTIPDLPLTTEWQTLVLRRALPDKIAR